MASGEIRQIQIGDRMIGTDQPTYIIAEIGINHNGDPTIAKRLIEECAEAGVDAVKFQKRHLPSLYKEDVLHATNCYEQNFQYMIPVLKRVELPLHTYHELKAYSQAKGLEFLCTPFDIASAQFLDQLGINAFKIASADLTNHELLEYIACIGKPMILSTGMSLWVEIEQAVELLERIGVPFALLHCRSVYPVWPREVNLRMINRLSRFGRPVGYSGHELGLVIALVAASMGACIIEKHVTLDKRMDGPDHKISLEPFELKRLVRDIRVADQARGNGKRSLLRGEILNRELFGKSLVASTDIHPGTVITREMVRVQGPGKGISPNRLNELVGKIIYRPLNTGDYFLDQDIDGPPDSVFTDSFHSRWGLICRFSDMDEFLCYQPKVVEFHLAENDFDFPFPSNGKLPQELIVHVPEYIGDRILDLCSSSEQIRSRSVLMVQRTIDLTHKIAPQFEGTPKVIAHPGAMSMNVKLDKKTLRRNLLRSMAEVKCDGVELLMENLPPYPWYFGGQWKGNYFMSAEDIEQFCQDTGQRICFDLSHAALYCNAKKMDLTDFIRKVKPFIRHIHFADAYGLDGEGVQIGEGDIDFDAVMPLFAGYEETWVPEIWRGHLFSGRGFLQALDKLRKINW